GLSGPPGVIEPVCTVMFPASSISISIVSIERAAGPNTRTPALVYVDAWHGQRYQPPSSPSYENVPRHGTVHPRWGHFRQRTSMPSAPPEPPGRVSAPSMFAIQN